MNPIQPHLAARLEITGLAALRGAVIDAARACGLPEDGIDRFALAVNEIATNAVTHGGGLGQLWLWSEDHQLVCRVSDHGPGFPAGYQVPAQPPPPSNANGRGIWLACQVSRLEICTAETGATVNIRVAMPDLPMPRVDLVDPHLDPRPHG